IDVADIQGLTIKVLRSLIRKGSADLVIGKVEEILTHDVTFGAALRDDRRRDRGQIENAPAVQRQLIAFALVNDRAERRSLGLHQRRFPGHFDDLAYLPDL